MAFEIERKFLVKGDFKKFVSKSQKIIQAYLSTVPERTVRVRIKDEKAFLTIKGASNISGVSRYEFEKEISVKEAKELLEICESGLIEKTRFLIKSGDFTFEVDEFHGENQGLIIAEIELKSEDEIFEKPDWLGKEVTGNNKYYNSSLIKKPFRKW